jgi:hypothetical protein
LLRHVVGPAFIKQHGSYDDAILWGKMPRSPQNDDNNLREIFAPSE